MKPEKEKTVDPEVCEVCHGKAKYHIGHPPIHLCGIHRNQLYRKCPPWSAPLLNRFELRRIMGFVFPSLLLLAALVPGCST